VHSFDLLGALASSAVTIGDEISAALLRNRWSLSAHPIVPATISVEGFATTVPGACGSW
jgi:hypothetical protein